MTSFFYQWHHFVIQTILVRTKEFVLRMIRPTNVLAAKDTLGLIVKVYSTFVPPFSSLTQWRSKIPSGKFGLNFNDKFYIRFNITEIWSNTPPCSSTITHLLQGMMMVEFLANVRSCFLFQFENIHALWTHVRTGGHAWKMA